MSITFEVEYHTEYGQNIYICGSTAQFGNWSSQNAIKMNYTTNGKWRKTVQISDSLPNGSILRYKYVLLDDRKPNGGVPQWEPGAQPREIKIEDNTRDIEGKQLQEIPLKGFKGKLFRSGMPFSPMFDPYQTAYKEFFEKEIDVVVCLSWRKECEDRVGFDLLQKYGTDGFAVINFPIDDLSTPSVGSKFSVFVDKIAAFLTKGCNVVIHCHAGIGRTGLTICCLAKRYANIPQENLISWIREFIPGAVQTERQVSFVKNF